MSSWWKYIKKFALDARNCKWFISIRNVFITVTNSLHVPLSFMIIFGRIVYHWNHVVFMFNNYWKKNCWWWSIASMCKYFGITSIRLHENFDTLYRCLSLNNQLWTPPHVVCVFGLLFRGCRLLLYIILMIFSILLYLNPAVNFLVWMFYICHFSALQSLLYSKGFRYFVKTAQLHLIVSFYLMVSYLINNYTTPLIFEALNTAFLNIWYTYMQNIKWKCY